MYSPKEFIIKDLQEIYSFLSENPLGIIISKNKNSELEISHIPFHIKQENDTFFLEAHISNVNFQKKDLINNSNCTVVFQGANTYISSSLYDHDNVPTWNYQAVHIHGFIEILSEMELIQHLDELTKIHEEKRENPICYSDFNQKLVTSYLDKITGFRIKSNKVEAVFKLSQNRNKSDFQSIVYDLENNFDKQANLVATAMKKIKKL